MAFEVTTEAPAGFTAGSTPADPAGAVLARTGAGGAQYKSDRRLSLTAEGGVVDADDPAGVVLLVGKGGTIPQSLADDLGISGKPAAEAEAPETPAPASPPAIEDLPLTDAQKAAIAAAGYDSREKLTAATDDQLRAIPGIGDASIAKLRDLYPSA
jgi:hypothetical protein